MTRRFSLCVAGAVGCAVLGMVSVAAAQAPQPGSVGAETIRRALTAPGAWVLNWPDTTLAYMVGNALLTFEARGDGLVVRIDNRVQNRGCEKPVVVSNQGIAFDGCFETGIELRATPEDPVFAFRGASPVRWFTLTPHTPPRTARAQ